MDANVASDQYQTISQRVISTYARMLADFCPVPVNGAGEQAQADLHGFFQALYQAMDAAPEQFGLPVTPDCAIVIENNQEHPDKSEAKRRLDKPRKLIGEGLDFLYALGQTARLADDTLVLDPDSPALAFLKKKTGRAWLNGLAGVGLTLREADGAVTLACARFPGMPAALQALARACAACPDGEQGRVFFARCDFNALRGDFSVDALALYRIFSPADYARAEALHAFFTGRGYRAQVELGRIFAWVIKYQGSRAVKGTPLFQISFDERYRQPLRAGIKCASAQRVVPLLPAQSAALRADFDRRVFTCGSCHWCDNSKALGPTPYEYAGRQREICWYVPSDIPELTGETVELVKEYAIMHERMG